MHIITQHLSERIVEDVREGMVGQNPLTSILVPLTPDFVSHCKRSLSTSHMQHIASRNLQSNTLCGLLS